MRRQGGLVVLLFITPLLARHVGPAGISPYTVLVISDHRGGPGSVPSPALRGNLEAASSLLLHARRSPNASITKALLCITPKAGSTSILEWLMLLSTNESFKDCRNRLKATHTARQIGYLHDIAGPCWIPRAAPVVSETGSGSGRAAPRIVVLRASKLPPREKFELSRELGAGGGLPAAPQDQAGDHQQQREKWYTACIVRNPVDRMISAWKSKLACGGAHGATNAAKARELFGTDVKDSIYLIPPLIKGARADAPTLARALQGRKCLQFTDAINLLEGEWYQ